MPSAGTPLPVTLVIPTVHHRAGLYARALRHLGASGFRSPIIVSDHSPAEHLGVIEEITRRHRELSVTLLHHGPDAHFLTRLGLCASAAETPYVHLHADDDFLVVPTLGRLVEEMERRPDSVAAMGLNVHAWLDTGQLTPLPKTAISFPHPFDRLLGQLECYSSVLYALRRREELVSSLAFAVQHCPDVQFWQYLESCVAALSGPIMVVDDLHYVRGVHEGKWSTTLVRDRSLDHFPFLILSPDFQPRLRAFRASLVAACEERGVRVDADKLDSGLIHLLYRGFGAMGLPARHTGLSHPSQESALRGLEHWLQSPADPTTIALQRIFESSTDRGQGPGER